MVDPPVVATSSITATRWPGARSPSIPFDDAVVLAGLADGKGLDRTALELGGEGGGHGDGIRTEGQPAHGIEAEVAKGVKDQVAHQEHAPGVERRRFAVDVKAARAPRDEPETLFF